MSRCLYTCSSLFFIFWNIGPMLIVDSPQVSCIQYLGPEIIESKEILKNAASASIYGSESGNIVVIITTKNGSSQGHASIIYNGKFTINFLERVPKLLNASEFIDWMKMNLGETQVNNDMETYESQLGWDPNTDTNWMDEFLEQSWTRQHSLSFQGGNDRGNYFVYLNYVNQNGIEMVTKITTNV